MEELSLPTDLCSVVSWQHTLLLLTGSTAPGMDESAFLLWHRRDLSSAQKHLQEAASQKIVSYSKKHKVRTWRQRERRGLGRGVQGKYIRKYNAGKMKLQRKQPKSMCSLK